MCIYFLFRFDYLEIRDGFDEVNSTVSKFCGSEPLAIFSRTNHVYVYFVSDGFYQEQGFSIYFSTVTNGCVEILDDKMTGLVTSPNYPLIYPNNKKCVTIIRAPLPDHFIRLNVTFLDIEGDDNCTFDFLEIYDNEDEGKVSSSGRLCGTLNNEKIYESKENSMKLVLYEDLMIQSDSGRVQVLPGGVLDIKSFNENFEGVYKCLASTQNDFAEFTFRLTMLLGYGYYLTLDSVTLSDAGQYKCKARSSYGCYVERSASLSVTQKEQEQGVCGRTQGNKDLTQTLTSRISGGTEYCDGYNGTKRKIQSFTIHQNFSQRAPYDNDIALIKLNSPINYTDVIKPICTKPFGLVNDMFFERRVGRKVGRVIGCGRIYENIEEAPTKLHDVYVPNVDRHLCDQADIGHRNFTDSMICAGYDRAYFGDACYGDSGGSLTMQMSRNDPWILVGLVSWGVGCDRSGHYGYYTNVAMFVDWINQQTSV
ncbi:hypothetical protein KUTeg_000669 [Tegillarca granosa]|uniref:Uncharacterized protein n=1 Tax=Tegillarca granosa TaxID=220873 RepID=A0ABQ9G2J0_TEGGR|nr:hypothetical protein KUTeg_000669 [Tegillarca granosa]